MGPSVDTRDAPTDVPGGESCMSLGAIVSTSRHRERGNSRVAADRLTHLVWVPRQRRKQRSGALKNATGSTILEDATYGAKDVTCN